MKTRYADLHCDALTRGLPQADFLHTENGQISLDNLVSGDCALQCFAAFSRESSTAAYERALRYIAAFHNAKTELLSAHVTPVLSIENGGIVEGDLSRLERLIASGAELFGFTWNGENCLGYPCGESGGLKPFGKTAAEALCAKNVLIDVSHLSDKGAFEAAEIAARYHVPIVASHSLCRAVEPHKRNLRDEEIRAIACTGGAVGVNFVREFAGRAGLGAHVKHLLNTGGEDVLAIGSDFDGTIAPIYRNAGEMPRFFEEMKKAGLTARQIEKLALKNVCRVLGKRGVL